MKNMEKMMNNAQVTADFAMAASAAEAGIVLHPAPHHADDVFCAAMKRLMDGQPVRIFRTRAPKLIETAWNAGAVIADVGGVYDPENNQFDHHQDDAPVRCLADGKEAKCASFGQMWGRYGGIIIETAFDCPPELAGEAKAKVDEMLVKGIDLLDNGVAEQPRDIMSISMTMSVFNSNWNEDPTDDTGFLMACEIAYAILKRVIKSAIASVSAMPMLNKWIAECTGSILELPYFMGAWKEAVLRSGAKNILFSVFENKIQHQWNVVCVPPSVEELMGQRKPLPQAWYGLSGQALADETGVADAVFCHGNGFMAAAKSREGALALARLALEA